MSRAGQGKENVVARSVSPFSVRREQRKSLPKSEPSRRWRLTLKEVERSPAGSERDGEGRREPFHQAAEGQHRSQRARGRATVSTERLVRLNTELAGAGPRFVQARRGQDLIGRAGTQARRSVVDDSAGS